MSSSSTSIGCSPKQEEVSLVEGLLQEQVDRVLVEVSAPVFVAVPVAGHRALLWLSHAS